MRESDDKPGKLAFAIMAAAVVTDLKADAAELAKVFDELDERERERFLVLLLGS